MRSADLPDRDRLAPRDVAACEVHPPPQDLRRGDEPEGFPQREEVDGVRSEGDEDLESGLFPDLAGEVQGAGVRDPVVLRPPDRDVFVRRMGEHEGGPARLLELLRGHDAEPRRSQVEVVVEDRHAGPRHRGGA